MSNTVNYSRNIMVLVRSDSAIVDFNNANFGIYVELLPDSSTFTINLQSSHFYEYGFQRGSVAFLTAYTYVGLTAYQDLITGKYIYTSLGANVASATLHVP